MMLIQKACFLFTMPFLLFSTTQAKTPGGQSGEWRTFNEIQIFIGDELSSTKDTRFITECLGFYGESYMGGFNATTQRMSQMTPNVFGTLLWQRAMTCLAKKISSSSKYNLKWRSAKLNSVSEELLNNSRSKKAWQNYWLFLMRYRAPQLEFEHWYSWFRPSSGRNLNNQEFFTATQALLMNPYFLLKI